MENMTTINFRIDSELKNAFDKVAKDNDQTASQLLRAFIRASVEEHAKEPPQEGTSQAQGSIKTTNQRARPQKKKKTPENGASSLFNGMFNRIKP